MKDCVFCNIVEKNLPSTIYYEDEQVIVFQNNRPLTPVHLLIIPRKHYDSLNELEDDNEALPGHMLLVARKMAEKMGIKDKGYRLVINTGAEGGQTVFHLHLHLLGGKSMSESLQLQGLK